MSLQSIHKGSRGPAVRAWQTFLRGLDGIAGAKGVVVDGIFGSGTEKVTKAFQKKQGLGVDGWVGRGTYAAAMALGFDPVDYSKTKRSENKPVPKPNFFPLTAAKKQKLFGEIEFKAAGTSRNPEAIKITNGRVKDNIVRINIPQLHGVHGAGKLKTFWFNKAIADQTQAMFQAWEDEGLSDLIISYAGSWVPRFIRGSRSKLSSHSWGTAFDINAAWNGMGREPANWGAKGSVRELVSIAHKHGFYWGGHFSRKDGMHFEAVKIL